MSMTEVCARSVTTGCAMWIQLASSLRVCPASPMKYPAVIRAASGYTAKRARPDSWFSTIIRRWMTEPTGR